MENLGRLFIAIIVIAFALNLTSCSDGAEVVERVVDGDTIILESGEILRLARIDSNELTDRIKSKRTKAYAAKYFLTNLIEGKRVYVYRLRIGYFGRTISEVYYDHENLSDLMFNRRMAKRYHKSNKYKY